MSVGYILSQLDQLYKDTLKRVNDIHLAVNGSNLTPAYKALLTDMTKTLLPKSSHEIMNLKHLFPERYASPMVFVKFGDARVYCSFPLQQNDTYFVDVFFPKNGRDEESILDRIFEDYNHEEHSDGAYHWSYFENSSSLMCHRLPPDEMSIESRTTLPISDGIEKRSRKILNEFGINLAPLSFTSTI